MLIDNYNSFNRNFDFLSNYSSPSPFTKRKKYYETTIKKSNCDKEFSNFDSNSLINALRNFSVKFKLDDKKILKDYKFVISFDELISIIIYSLESQKHLNDLRLEESESINNFTHNFINNISNYIYSYEKVEKIDNITKIPNKIKSPSNKENININTKRNKNKKPSLIQSSSCLFNAKMPKIKQCKKREKKKINYQNNLQNNKSTNNHNINNTTTNNNTNNNKINNNNKSNDIYSNEIQNYTSTYFKRKNFKNLSNVFSPVKKSFKKEQAIKVTTTRTNKSAERRRVKSHYNNYLQNENKESSNNLNKSTERRKSTKIENNSKISIFTACEFLRSSSYILKNRNKDFNNNEKTFDKINKNDSNNSNNNIKKEDKEKKIIYYNQNINLGIKRRVIRGNVPRPSNLASKLLEKGIKYIADFNGLNEEESRKKHY